MNLLWFVGTAIVGAGLMAYRQTTHYQQHMPWIGKRVMDIVIFAVSRTQQSYVAPTKAKNEIDGKGHDLTPEQAHAAVELAKQNIRVAAKENGLERALPPDAILEAKIEQVVQQRKAAQRGPAGKGR